MSHNLSHCDVLVVLMALESDGLMGNEGLRVVERVGLGRWVRVMSNLFTEAILVRNLALMAVSSEGMDMRDKRPSAT